MTNDFVTVKEASEYLGVSKTWINVLIRRGQLTKYRRLGSTLLSKKELDKLNQPKPVRVK